MTLDTDTRRVPRLLLITGSTRLRSTNTAALRIAHEVLPDATPTERRLDERDLRLMPPL